MTIPYTDDELLDEGKCCMPENIDTDACEGETSECKSTTDYHIFINCQLDQTVKLQSVSEHRGISKHNPLTESLGLFVLVILALIFWKNVIKYYVKDAKVQKLHHRVKIKIKWAASSKMDALNIKCSKSEWIFNKFIRPFQKIPQYVFQTYPFLPQDYNSLCQNGEKRRVSDPMKFEGARLATFSTFPASAGVYATRLASAGFYYIGNGDEVVCFSCGIKYNNWHHQDSPQEIHKRISPNCAFVQDTISRRHLKENESRTASENHIAGACGTTRDLIEADNKQSKKNDKEVENYTATSNRFYDSTSQKHDVNIKTDPNFTFKGAVNKESLPVVSTQNNAYRNTDNINSEHLTASCSFSNNDTHSLIRIPQSNTSKPPIMTSNIAANTFTNESRASLESLTMGVCLDKPKYPKYAIRTSRLDSFQNWPRHLTQSPEEMALAGFFFTGIEDHCRCFFCGGGLKNWEHDDQPWIEHARWYQNCAFVRQCKGDKFTEDVQTNKYNGVPSKLKNEEIIRPAITSNSQMIQNGYKNHPAVQSVSEFGYDSDLVKKAYDSLLNAGAKDITGTSLLEAIFQLEESKSRNQPEIPTESRSTKPGKPQELIHNKGQKEKAAEPELELSIKSLEEENQNLRDQQTCKICLDEPVAIVFLPCGHMASCVNCAPALRRCPICRAFIKGTVKAIMC